MEELSSRVHQLIENDLVDSAATLCTFMLNSKESDLLANDTATVLELLGDCMVAKKEYKRALNIYRQAARSISPTALFQPKKTAVETENDARLRAKEAQCHIHLRDFIELIK